MSKVMVILINFIIDLVNKVRFSNLASVRRYYDAQLNLKLATVF